MPARFPPKPPRRKRRDVTLDLDATLDVYQENTADLQANVSTDAPHPDMMATARMEAIPPTTLSLTETLLRRPAKAAATPAAPDSQRQYQDATSVAVDPSVATDDAVLGDPAAEDVTQLRAFTPAPPAAGSDNDDAALADVWAKVSADSDGAVIAPEVATTASSMAAAATPPPRMTTDTPSPQEAAPVGDTLIAPEQADQEVMAAPAGLQTPADTDPTPDQPAATAPTTLTADTVEQPPAPAPGNVLLGRYLLEQVIGCGGTAVVFSARDLQAHNKQAPNARLAIKTPRPELGDLPRATLRLQHEFEHARRLHHPNVVEVFEFRREGGQPYMMMELIDGRLLSRVLRERAPLHAALARSILHQCAAVLQHAHDQQITHGDFKPGNVFITGEDTVRIVDFGAAATPASEASRIPAGTPTYASPEVLQGHPPQPGDDVFSFACVAYEVLAGQHPFERLSSLQAREEKRVPPRAAGLSKPQWLALVAALSWNRQERPGDINTLMEQLFPTPVEPPAAVVTTPTAAVTEPPAPPPAPLAQGLVLRQRNWGFLAFLACIVVVTVFAIRHRSGSDEPPALAAPAPVAPASIITPPANPLTADAAAGTGEGVDQLTAANEAAAFNDEIIEVEEAPIATAPPRPSAPAPVSEISFASSRIVTTESSFAAVFVVNRSAPLNNRVTVNWRAVSGSAQAGEDFIADAGGTIVFAVNQAQRAIYVPLIDNTVAEADKTFTVVLESPRGARLGEVASAEALIRDDD